MQAEILEDRTLLSTVSFTGLSGVAGSLTFDGIAGADDVQVSSPGANTLQIDVGGSDTIALAGGAAGNPDFVLSNGDQTLTVDTTLITGSPILNIDINGNAGDDNIVLANDLSSVLSGTLTLDGGAGDDTLVSNSGQLVSVINGGDGNDMITSGGLFDIINAGGGNDVVELNTGAGNDSITVSAVLTTGAIEVASLSPISSSTITGTETIDLNTEDGDDSVLVTDLSVVGDLTTLNIDVGNGSNSVDVIDINNGGIQVAIVGGEDDDTIDGTPNDDIIDGGGGDDTINGGGGNDTIDGGEGMDTIDGGDGNDTITGGPGDDTIDGGADDDLIIWNDGDGSDSIDGGAGMDTLQVNGSNDPAMGDDFEITADGTGFDLTRVGDNGLPSFTLDNENIETLEVNGTDGDDTLDITEDLAGVNGLTNLDIDLGEGEDEITVSGDPDADVTLNAETLNLEADITGMVTGNADVINVTPPGTIQDALDAANNVATINISPANYAEVVNASATGTDKDITFGIGDVPPGEVGTVGTLDLTVDADDVLAFDVNGVDTAGVDYDQLQVTGTVDLTGSRLMTSGTVTETQTGDMVVLIDNDGTDAVTGEFENLPEGGVVVINGEIFNISYQGGDGNDVVLSARPANADIRVVGTGPGIAPSVEVRNAFSNEVLYEITPYDPAFGGGVRVAVGDVNGDGTPDIITGAGPGGGPHIRVFDGETQTEILGFMAFDPLFNGGVHFDVADIDGDNLADIIVGAGAGGGPHVRVFSGDNGSELFSFFAYDSAFAGGVQVAAGDISGDGRPDLITGAGPGGGPHVRVFEADPLTGNVTPLPGEIGSFFAYDPGFQGGVFVASADITGDGRPDLITGAGAGGGPHVKVFDGALATLTEARSFFAYNPGFAGGVRVAATDVTGDGRPDIITGAGPGGGPHVIVRDGTTLETVASFFPYDPAFTGGVFVAGSVDRTGPDLQLADGSAPTGDDLDLLFSNDDLLSDI